MLILIVLFASACEPVAKATVLVQYGCDIEDLVIETWDGATQTEVIRFAPGSAPTCFQVAMSKVASLHSRCVSSLVHVPVQIGVFDTVQECN